MAIFVTQILFVVDRPFATLLRKDKFIILKSSHRAFSRPLPLLSRPHVFTIEWNRIAEVLSHIHAVRRQRLQAIWTAHFELLVTKLVIIKILGIRWKFDSFDQLLLLGKA